MLKLREGEEIPGRGKLTEKIEKILDEEDACTALQGMFAF